MKCSICSQNVVPNRKMCKHHLRTFKLRQRKHEAARRAVGRCISCSEPALPGTGRCSKHTEYTRAKARAWMAVNGKARWAALAERSRTTGKCAYCGKRKVIVGTLRCPSCKKRLQSYN